MSMTAEKAGLLFDSTEAPYRGSLPTAVPTDPVIYRFYELVQVYGTTWKEMPHEGFGDGIMSASDFDVTLERQPDRKGDRVRIDMSGKSLPYKRHRSPHGPGVCVGTVGLTARPTCRPNGPCRRRRAVARGEPRDPGRAHRGARRHRAGAETRWRTRPRRPHEGGPATRPEWTRGRAQRPAGSSPPYAAPTT